MQRTISISTITSNPLPHAAAYVETFDTDDDVEPADVLSFEALRDAFSALRSTEKELAQSIPDIELSEEKEVPSSELPDYDVSEDIVDSDEHSVLAQKIETPHSVDIRLETIVEAMLFVGNRENRPLTAEQITENLRNVSVEEVDQTVEKLNKHYQEWNCPYMILSERNGYRMVLRLEYESVRANFYGKVRGSKLSQQAVETLAVVAYRQPITAEEIHNICDQSCSAILDQLVRRNLLGVRREIKDEKKIVSYYTTPRFLEIFQIQSLDELPKMEEWESV